MNIWTWLWKRLFASDLERKLERHQDALADLLKEVMDL